MGRVIRWGLAILVLLGATAALQHIRLSPVASLPAPPDADLRVATWNVHYILTNRAEGRWGLSGWEERKVPMDATFKALAADIVAFQEMESFAGGNDDSDNRARRWLLAENPGYAAAAIGDWRDFPSTQPVFYRPDRFGVLQQGWFFFSDTPEVIYSRSFDGRYPAFASWVQFQDMSDNRAFRVVNVHLDAGSRLNRRRSAALVAERVRPWIEAGEAVILTGDLNALHGSGIHDSLTAAGLQFPPVPAATYHLDRGLNLLPAIDFIGLSGAVTRTAGPFVLDLPTAPVRAADHYPVAMDLRLGPAAQE